MKSSELSGFTTWEAWSSKTVNQSPQKPGIYVFRLARATSFCRIKGDSDVVYIGSTKKGKRTIRSRLMDHLNFRSKDVSHRIKRVEEEVGKLEVAWKPFDNHKDAAFQEGELLARYREDHIELPPLNHQESGKRVQTAVRAMRELSSDQQTAVLGKLRQGVASAPPERKLSNR